MRPCYGEPPENSRIGAAVHLRVIQRQMRPCVKCPLVLAERYWMSAAVSPGSSRERPRKSIAESTTKTTRAITIGITNAASSRSPSQHRPDCPVRRNAESPAHPTFHTPSAIFSPALLLFVQLASDWAIKRGAGDGSFRPTAGAARFPVTGRLTGIVASDFARLPIRMGAAV